MGSSCFETALVIGNNLVPLPPARIMPHRSFKFVLMVILLYHHPNRLHIIIFNISVRETAPNTTIPNQ